MFCEAAGEATVLVIGGHAGSLVNFRAPLLKALRKRGYRVVAAAPALTSDVPTRDALTSLGVQCEDVKISRTGLNPAVDIGAVFDLVRLIKAHRPEVVLGYTAKPAIFGTIAARIAKVPRRYALITGLGYAFTVGKGGLRTIVRRALSKLYKIAFKHATKVFFQNRDDAALFEELGLLPATLPVVIVNGSGIDLQEFEPAPFPSTPLKFLLIARLVSAKGIREYARAAAEVRARHPTVECHLVGGVDTNPDAIPAEEVERWNTEHALIWHGELSDVRPQIAAAHVYVLPSYREGTPRSVLEAMGMGRPIITTDAPGCRETVVDGVNGFLVPPQTVAPLIAAMERFILKPSLIPRMGARSLDIVRSKYDANKVNAQMLREMELA